MISIEYIKEIDAQKIAQEIIGWMIKNVENYVDNTTRHYKIDLVLENEELPETKKLQDIYLEYGKEDEKNQKKKNKKKEKELLGIREALDEKTQESYDLIKNDEDNLNILTQRMLFFYEKIIPTPESKKQAFEIDNVLKDLIGKKEKAKSEKQKQKIQQQIKEKVDEGVSLVKFTELEGVAKITKFEYEAFNVNVQIKQGQKEEKDKKVVEEYMVPEGFTVWMEISHKIKNQRPTAIF